MKDNTCKSCKWFKYLMPMALSKEVDEICLKPSDEYLENKKIMPKPKFYKKTWCNNSCEKYEYSKENELFNKKESSIIPLITTTKVENFKIINKTENTIKLLVSFNNKEYIVEIGFECDIKKEQFNYVIVKDKRTNNILHTWNRNFDIKNYVYAKTLECKKVFWETLAFVRKEIGFSYYDDGLKTIIKSKYQ